MHFEMYHSNLLSELDINFHFMYVKFNKVNSQCELVINEVLTSSRLYMKSYQFMKVSVVM